MVQTGFIFHMVALGAGSMCTLYVALLPSASSDEAAPLFLLLSLCLRRSSARSPVGQEGPEDGGASLLSLSLLLSLCGKMH